jgi:hypothetical protein
VRKNAQRRKSKSKIIFDVPDPESHTSETFRARKRIYEQAVVKPKREQLWGMFPSIYPASALGRAMYLNSMPAPFSVARSKASALSPGSGSSSRFTC